QVVVSAPLPALLLVPPPLSPSPDLLLHRQASDVGLPRERLRLVR
nr:hypothetical protein [Tanacetum cinerariifolium]